MVGHALVFGIWSVELRVFGGAILDSAKALTESLPNRMGWQSLGLWTAALAQGAWARSSNSLSNGAAYRGCILMVRGQVR